MRGDAAFQSEAAKSANIPIHLVSVELACSIAGYGDQASCETAGGVWTPPIYMTDFDRTISWGGNDYLAVGSLLEIGNVNETLDLKVSTLRLTLSGVDQSFISLLLTKNYIDRVVKVHKSFIDNVGQMTIAPVEVFRGYIDEPAIQDSPKTTTITVAVRSHFADFERKSGRHTNNAEMQHFFPGDDSFKYASEGLKEIRWGSESQK